MRGLVGIVILLVVCVAWWWLRERAFARLADDAFLRHATIANLDETVSCMSTGEEGRAQRDAFAALARAASCDPVDRDCWRRMVTRERARHGRRTASADLRFLRDWCTPGGVRGPPRVA